MASVTSLSQDIPISKDEIMQDPPEYSQPCTEDLPGDPIERESPSQYAVNFLADVISSQECSQAPPGGATPVSSQQPSPEYLMTLGIRVRDFAYENTLPAIVPVPRVPRQTQPAPLKRSHRDWDSDKEGALRPFTGQTKKPRSLERKATEPASESAVQHTRTLGRVTMKKLHSLVSSPRNTLHTAARRRFSASPPTSPLTPPPAHLASREHEHIQTSSALPFIVRAENPSTVTVPASQLGSESQLPPLHPGPVVYPRFSIVDSHLSPGRSPVPGPPKNASPSPLISALIGSPSPGKDSDADPRVRRCRGRGTPPPSNRYHLRQRPIPSSRTSTLSCRPHPPPSPSRPTRRVR